MKISYKCVWFWIGILIIQLCGVRGNVKAPTKSLLWQPRKSLTFTLTFESEQERNTAIALARKYAFDCNVSKTILEMLFLHSEIIVDTYNRLFYICRFHCLGQMIKLMVNKTFLLTNQPLDVFFGSVCCLFVFSHTGVQGSCKFGFSVII